MRSLSTLTLSTILSAAALPPAPSSASEQSRPESDLNHITLDIGLSRPDRNMPTFEELAGAPNEAAVKRLYAARGMQFSTEGQFLATVQRDWALRCLEVVNAAAASREFKAAAPVEVKADGVTYHIYGIIHTDPVRARYEAAFTKSKDQAPILTEQNLSRFVGPRAKELADHVVITSNPNSSAFQEFAFGFTGEQMLFFQLAESVYPSTPELDEGGIMEAFQPSPFDRKPLDEIYAAMPVQALGTNSLPVFMTLDIKERTGINLDWVEARSAYMAEVLRRWTKAGDHRDIVCGAGHTEEIAYFLQHPSKDPFIIGLAEKHAAILNQADAAAANGEQPLAGEQGYGGWFAAGNVTEALVPSLILLGIALGLNRAVNNYCRRQEEAAQEEARKQKEAAEAAAQGPGVPPPLPPSLPTQESQELQAPQPPPPLPDPGSDRPASPP